MEGNITDILCQRLHYIYKQFSIISDHVTCIFSCFPPLWHHQLSVLPNLSVTWKSHTWARPLFQEVKAPSFDSHLSHQGIRMKFYLSEILSLTAKQFKSTEFKRRFWWGHILVRAKPGLSNSIEDLTKVYTIMLRENLVYKWMLKPMYSGYANVIQLFHPMNYPLPVRLWKPWYWNNEMWKSMLCERTKENYKSGSIKVYL